MTQSESRQVLFMFLYIDMRWELHLSNTKPSANLLVDTPARFVSHHSILVGFSAGFWEEGGLLRGCRPCKVQGFGFSGCSEYANTNVARKTIKLNNWFFK